MRMDKLTHSLQAVLGSAQSLAVGYEHPFIEPTHILQAMLATAGSPTRHLLRAAGAQVEQLRPRIGLTRTAVALTASGETLVRHGGSCLVSLAAQAAPD